MSTVTFEAVYENGVLRPTEPLPLKPDEQVLVTLHLATVADWPDDTEIYKELEAEDRQLAAAMWPGVQANWPQYEEKEP